jgi:hypothetical protein
MSNYAVVPADLNRDAEQIIAVWARNLAPRTAEQLRGKLDWHYRQNPCGHGKCLLLLTGEGAVVGAAGLGLRRMRLAGSTVLVGHASDLAVDASHRGIRPAMMLQRAMADCIGKDLPLIYTSPNDRALNVMRLVGFNVVSQYGRYVKVLQAGQYMQAIPGIARVIMAPFVNAALRIRSADTWHSSRGYRLKEVSSVDQRFDQLWDRASAQADALGERSAAFVRWRYLDCPLQKYRLLAMLTPDADRVAGYAVCAMGERKQLSVIDLLVESPEVWDPLLYRLIGWARREGAHSISIAFAGDGGLTPRLERLGFRPRDERRAVVASPAELLKSRLAPASGARLLGGDEDYNS